MMSSIITPLFDWLYPSNRRVALIQRCAVSAITCNRRSLALYCTLLFCHVSPIYAMTTLAAVKERNVVVCGIHSSSPGMAIKDQGHWQGLEADFCRAVASATLGLANRVRFVPFALEKGYTALQTGEIDLLVREVPINTGLEAQSGLLFTGPLYYTSYAIMARADADLYSLDDVGAQSVCTAGVKSSLAFQRYIQTAGSAARPMELGSPEGAAKAFEQDRCELVSADSRTLYYLKKQQLNSYGTRILAGVYEVTATSPLVRSSDINWFKIVRAVQNLLLFAEQQRISIDKASSLDMTSWNSLSIVGLQLGLAKDWHRSVIGQIGNYATLFDRHIGPDSSIGMPRGMNRLVTDGGQHIPYPFDSWE